MPSASIGPYQNFVDVPPYDTDACMANINSWRCTVINTEKLEQRVRRVTVPICVTLMSVTLARQPRLVGWHLAGRSQLTDAESLAELQPRLRASVFGLSVSPAIAARRICGGAPLPRGTSECPNQPISRVGIDPVFMFDFRGQNFTNYVNNVYLDALVVKSHLFMYIVNNAQQAT